MLRLVFKDAVETKSLPWALKQRVSPHVVLGVLNSLAIVVPVLAVLVLGFRRRWVAEDAFISMRVVEQILAGNGPVFNAGERVEAHTNPLWVAVLTVFGALGANTMLTAVALGLLWSAAGLFAAILASDRIGRRLERSNGSSAPSLLVPIGAMVFIAIPVGWDFVTSGLESGLGFGWLGISFWVLVRALSADQSIPQWHWYASAAVLGIGPLIRPDFAIFSAGFVSVLIYLHVNAVSRRFFVRPLLLIGLSAVALPALYQIFRMGYYAALVPNSALAKEAGENRWDQGLIYLNDFVGTYWLWVPIALVLGWWMFRLYLGARVRDWPVMVVLAVPVLTAIAHSLYVMRVGGDFMHGRMLLPAMFALILPLAAVRIPITVQPRVAIAGFGIAALAVWCLVSAGTLRSTLGGEIDPETGLIDERRYHIEETLHPNPVTLDDYINNGMHWAADGVHVRHLLEIGTDGLLYLGRDYPISDRVPSDVQMVLPGQGIGMFGMITGTSVHIVDRHGLADPIAGRLMIEARGRPGHEKMLPMIWIIARFSSIETEEMADPRFTSARAALECNQISKLTEAVTAPLTPGRFLDNIRSSFTFHSLRIPPDPHQAAERFCGSTPPQPVMFTGARPE